MEPALKVKLKTKQIVINLSSTKNINIHSDPLWCNNWCCWIIVMEDTV